MNPDSQFQPDANAVSVPNYFAWSNDKRVFAEMAAADAYRTGSLSEPGQQAEAIVYSAVSPNYFTLFGVAPVLGRAFLAGEDQQGHDHVVILSHGLWARRFGSDPAVVGRVVRLNREDYVVAGVMPANFRTAGIHAAALDSVDVDRGGPSAGSTEESLPLPVCAACPRGHSRTGARADEDFCRSRTQKDFPETEKSAGAHRCGCCPIS